MMLWRVVPPSWSLLGLCVFLTCSSAMGQEREASADDILRFGLSRSLFREFNAVDAIAATKVWLETIVQDRHIITGSETFLLENLEAINRAVEEHTFDIALMLAVEYLDLTKTGAVREWFTYRRGGDPGQKIVILVGSNSSYHSVGDLQGKNMVIFGGEQTEIAKFWLGVQTMTTSDSDIDGYFHTVEEVNRPIKAVLPVFFGQKDACLVTAEAFNMAAELNPQVGQRLHPIATSESFASVVLCAHRDSNVEMLKSIYDIFATAHLDPKAKQVFVTFRLNKLDPVEPTMLESVRQVKHQYERLKESSRLKRDRSVGLTEQSGVNLSESTLLQ